MAGFESFSIALDESTDLSDTTQLAIFIRGVDKKFTVIEKLLALWPLTAIGEDIFNEVHKLFTRFGLPWSKLVGVCTDGNKICLWEAQMLSGNSYNFTTLSAYENIAYVQCTVELKLLSEQFSNRFSDFENMEDLFNLFATPTKSNVQNAPIHLQMELIEIQKNSLLKSKFEDVELCDFCKKTP
ncbi:General transcription factor II-I repeat domain-containing protein 2 [Eumeta japonica]|uniref:General transcription factor II-I repeat domain-containing protein 2 n=1 Tax=Eumeta variegata TaxID=151549 RepID=A0A4C1YBV2_EUMVA|nr:General transcription factor II-I repeat domain-containing protein 2 [Eumeta japonica]